MTSTPPRRRQSARLVIGAALAALLATAGTAAPTHAASAQDVVVRESAGAGSAPERAVARLGGRVVRQLPLIDGFTARIPAGATAGLRASDGVHSVTVDRPFKLSSANDGVDPSASLALARATIGADDVPAAGGGVDVALIDSGVAPVAGIAGRLGPGVDLSADADVEGINGLDAFGHGTHLAGVVASVAPQSRVVSVRVADHAGNTSLTRLLAGVDWAARNATTGGRSIKVITLAFGADPAGSYRADSLALAVERAWQRGLTVVASAGNGGGETTGLDSPAYDPYVIAAGAQDTSGSPEIEDDIIADFSSRGSAQRGPDVVAPGVGIVSLRVPGSYLDEAFPQARIGEEQFRGSGTSQAAAVASGAAAVLHSARPDLTPDAAKALLRATARPLADVAADRQGAGSIDLAAAATAPVPADAAQVFPGARGDGPFRSARLGVQLAVENPNSEFWTSRRWSSRRWSGDDWQSRRWSSRRWSGDEWQSRRWSSRRWSADAWSSRRWSSDAWTSRRWSGDDWASRRWSTAGWTAADWSAEAGSPTS